GGGPGGGVERGVGGGLGRSVGGWGAPAPAAERRCAGLARGGSRARCRDRVSAVAERRPDRVSFGSFRALRRAAVERRTAQRGGGSRLRAPPPARNLWRGSRSLDGSAVARLAVPKPPACRHGTRTAR